MSGDRQVSTGAESSPFRLPHVPRLSIAYLMAWTAITAVLIAWRARGTVYSGELRWVLAIYDCSYSIVGGWVLMGSLLMIWHAVRRTLWPLEPGERLLLVMLGVFMVGVLGKWWLSFLFWPRRLADPYQYETFHNLQWWLQVIQFTLPALVVVLYLTMALTARRCRWWAAAIVCVAPGMSLWVMTFSSPESTVIKTLWLRSAVILGYVSFGLFVAAIISDHRGRRPRHWLHWSGAVLTLLALALVAGTATIRFFS